MLGPIGPICRLPGYSNPNDPLSAQLMVARRPSTVLAMTKWEYASVPLLVHATKQILDTWGEDGWELVSVVPGPGGPEQLVAYFKRESA